jgi:NAD(P)-dependent dehydrogenase (short-subunit alcohol dehydrogenase family)
MKTILVTGSSTGLGYASAVALARAGHEVFATMRNPARSRQLGELAKQESLQITIVPLDVNSDASVAAGMRKILDARGYVDVLVNNAGIAPLGSVEEAPLDEFRSTMETNYFGALRCIQAVLPVMRARRSGRIINVSSVAGKLAFPGQAAYCATKFALEALSEALAAEVRPFNIRVNVIEPGVIDTPIFDKIGAVSGGVYPGSRRMNAIFAAAREHPVPASVIGDQVVEIVDDESWTLRYPGGPAAAGILALRAGISDEQFLALNALPDDEWCDAIQQNFGLGVRPHLSPGPALT